PPYDSGVSTSSGMGTAKGYAGTYISEVLAPCLLPRRQQSACVGQLTLVCSSPTRVLPPSQLLRFLAAAQHLLEVPGLLLQAQASFPCFCLLHARWMRCLLLPHCFSG